MNWVQTPWAATLGRTLLHSLWEGAAIALVLTLVLAVARSSRVRYGAACVAMLAMLGGLVITFARLAPVEPVHIPIAVSGHGVALPPAFAAIPLAAPRAPGFMDNLAWLAPIWIAGVLIFYLRGVASWLVARRLRQTGVCSAPALWQSRVDRLRERLLVTRPVALLESCLAEVPVVIGYVRPIILMPVGLLAGLPTGQVEAILLHELVHIRRYDYLVNLLQVFVEGLVFYHPAVWWISGVMRAERENCCDDVVVAVTGGALEYAAALTALERHRGDAGMAMAATGGSLVNRIQRVLGRPQRRNVAVMPVFTAAVLTLTMVTAMAALSYQSKAGQSNRAEVAAPSIAKVADKPQLLAQSQPASSPAPADIMRQPTQVPSPDAVLYERAVAGIQSGNYVAARLTLNTLINSYPSSIWVIKAKLAIADSWQRQGGPQGKAQAAIEYKDFILFYPNTPEAREAELKLASLSTPYKKWLNEDVAYIISDEERKAFLQLSTDEEGNKFMEQFWLRRDPTPGTAQNEMKEEHYRRIAYVNSHYGTADTAGWRTDRGRIYIQYGPPDQIESHSNAGLYQRPASQGGGLAQTYPFEQWMYRWIEGVGQNVILEFVDPSGKGEYKMTMDPAEKDALMQRIPVAPAPVNSR